MLVQLGIADQACIFLVKRRIIKTHTGVFVDKKLGENNFVFASVLRIMWLLYRFQHNVWVTHTETITTRDSIAIIIHISLNSLNCFIIATKTYLCLYVSILWSDPDSSGMCLWNKIPIPPFGACQCLHNPCSTYWFYFGKHVVTIPKR